MPFNTQLKGSQTGSPKTERVHFTDKSIKYLQPTAKRRVVWAQGLKGFGIRITPSGTKSFVYKYDFDGQDRWITFGQYPKMRLAEALKRYADALAKVEEGEDPADENVIANEAKRKTLTVRQLANQYIEKYAKPNKRSWKEDERILENDVLGRWGGKRVSKITRRHVTELLDDIVARGAPVQANRTLAVVRRMFNFAVDRHEITSSPCDRIRPPSPESSKDRYLTLDEIKRFWISLRSAPLHRQTKLALMLGLVTLQRPGEVIGLNKRELDLKARTWTIPGERTKNKRPHLVPLSSLAIEILSELMKDVGENGFLFPGKGMSDHLTASTLSRAVSRNLEHFEVAKFTPHDLRRTGSTQLARFKVPRFERDRVLNHTDQTIGAVYDLYEYEDEKRAVLNMWSDIIRRCVGSKGKVDAKKLKSAIRYPKYLDR